MACWTNSAGLGLEPLIRKVSLWMGHSSIQSTETYLRADPIEKLEIMGDIVPPSLKRGRFTAPDKLMEMLRPGAGIC